MYGHEIEKSDKGYNIGLFKRRYFLRKKLVDVCLDVPSKEDAEKLVGMLDESLKAGMYLATKGEPNGKV